MRISVVLMIAFMFYGNALVGEYGGVEILENEEVLFQPHAARYDMDQTAPLFIDFDVEDLSAEELEFVSEVVREDIEYMCSVSLMDE